MSTNTTLSTVEDLAAELAAATTVHKRRGVVASDLWTMLLSEAQRELGRPTSSLLDTQSICFCFPEPPIIYPQTIQEVRDLWHTKATVAIQGIEQRNIVISSIAARMEAVLDKYVSCSIFLSENQSPSFSWHTDEWGAIVIQLSGSKQFEIEIGDSILVAQLAPSDWIRIETHEPHRAMASTMSLHLVFGRHDKKPLDSILSNI